MTPPPPPPPYRRVLERTRTTYYADDLRHELALGSVGTRALPCETRMACFTDAMLLRSFGSERIGDPLAAANPVLRDEGGYDRADGLWWARSGRVVYAPGLFYQPVRAYDPFQVRLPWNAAEAAEISPTYMGPLARYAEVEYETAGLFATRTTDVLGNTVIAEYDTRLLTPRQVTDANGNRTREVFDRLGRPEYVYVMGKDGASLPEGDVFVEGGSGSMEGAWFEYAEKSWQLPPNPTADDRARRAPPHAAAHVREVAGSATSPWQETVVYSDGFGRELVTKTKCEPAPGTTTERWIASGRAVYDNKGNAVKKYEPYFSASDAYEPEESLAASVDAVTPVLHHDPLGRVMRTDLPDGTYSTVQIDPWREKRFDGGDNVVGSRWAQDRAAEGTSSADARARTLSLDHANTPTVVHADALGRPIVMVADNGTAGRYATRVELDVLGHQRKVIDARGRVVQWQGYDMLGRALWTRAMDADGPTVPPTATDADLAALLSDASNPLRVTRALGDTLGKPLYKWTERGHVFHDRYDVARRLRTVTVTIAAEGEHAGSTAVTEVLLYGEDLVLADARASNLRGRLWRLFDGAGMVEHTKHDYRGNLAESCRQLVVQHKGTVDWSSLLNTTGDVDLAAYESHAESLLVAESFITRTTYDALGRPVTTQPPRSTSASVPDTHARLVRYTYDQGGALTAVDAQLGSDSAPWASYVTAVEHNARRQRTRIVYGNGLETRYTYDPQSFRLRSLRSERNVGAATVGVQDLGYTYDAAGNIVEIADRAANAAATWDATTPPARETHAAQYEYDAIGRLVSATGREHAATVGMLHGDLSDITNMPDASDLTATQDYTEQYQYDAVGNILAMIHTVDSVAGQSWTRSYAYKADASSDNNRLLRARVPSVVRSGDDFGYDAHGNMTRMPHLPEMEWNAYEEFVRTSNGGGRGRIEHHFQYDAQGQRVRKIVEHYEPVAESETDSHVTLLEERVYLGGYEVYRSHSGNDVGATVTKELQTLHIMDGERRCALVEVRTVGAGGAGSSGGAVHARYQLGNHLGSAAVEVDGDGALVSYEEHHPYGSAALLYQATANSGEPKRYRYTGMECDATGLQYHSSRYYATWLGRWTSTDPLMLGDGDNTYAYCKNSPAAAIDVSGTQLRQISDAGTSSPDASAQPNHLPDSGAAPSQPASPTFRQYTDQDNQNALHSAPLFNPSAPSVTQPYYDQNIQRIVIDLTTQTMVLDFGGGNFNRFPISSGAGSDSARTHDRAACAGTGMGHNNDFCTPITDPDGLYVVSTDNSTSRINKGMPFFSRFEAVDSSHYGMPATSSDNDTFADRAIGIHQGFPVPRVLGSPSPTTPWQVTGVGAARQWQGTGYVTYPDSHGCLRTDRAVADFVYSHVIALEGDISSGRRNSPDRVTRVYIYGTAPVGDGGTHGRADSAAGMTPTAYQALRLQQERERQERHHRPARREPSHHPH